MRINKALSGFALLSIVVGTPSWADKLCCQCGGFWAETTNSPTASCRIACSSNGGGWSGKSRVAADGEYCANPGGQRPTPVPVVPITQDEVAHEAWYAIYHQGAAVWELKGGAMRQGETLRKALTAIDSNEKEAMSRAPTSMLEAGTKQALAQCVSERNIDKDFNWVCYHERQAGDIRNRAAQGNAYAVRSVFSNYEKDDPNLKNRLYCRSDAEIQDLVKNHCEEYIPPPPGPPPKQQKEVDRGQGAGHN
jgi:hypothetical protein